MQNAEQKTALIAMSGGVDSSIAAPGAAGGLPLHGHDHAADRNEDLGACNFPPAVRKRISGTQVRVARFSWIFRMVLDLRWIFREKIIGIVRTYEAGDAQSCIDCNRFMKFEKLLDLPSSTA